MRGTPSKVGLGYENPTVSNHNFLIDYVYTSQNELNSFGKSIFGDG